MVVMSDLQQSVARHIRKTRTASGMQQQTLAEAVGVTRTSISNIENGRQALTLEMFYKISQVMKEDPGSFLTEALGGDKGVVVSAKEVRDPKIRKQIINTVVGGDDE